MLVFTQTVLYINNTKDVKLMHSKRYSSTNNITHCLLSDYYYDDKL